MGITPALEDHLMPPKIVLYHYPEFEEMPSVSPPCSKIHFVLRLMGLDYTTVDATSPWQAKKYSPSGRLPALAIDGSTLCDSIAIIDRLEELFPEQAIGPRDLQGRASDRLWDTFATDTLYWLFYYLRWLIPENAKKFRLAMAKKLWFVGRVALPLFIAPGCRKRARLQGVGARPRAEVQADLRRGLEMVATGLGEGPFLGGQQKPGRGDVAIATILLAMGQAGGMEQGWVEVRKHPKLRAMPGHMLRAASVAPPSWWEE